MRSSVYQDFFMETGPGFVQIIPLTLVCNEESVKAESGEAGELPKILALCPQTDLQLPEFRITY
jgi:hypothetical protein